MARTERENNNLLFGAVGVSGVLLVGAVVALKFLVRSPPPPPPPPPPAPETWVGRQQLRPIDYQATVTEDARRYGVAAPPPDVLGEPLVHTIELPAPRVLHPGESLDLPTLKLTTQVVKASAQDGAGQGFRYEHLVLNITNKTTHPVAYRVDTVVDAVDKCRSQGSVAHNAIALRGGEKLQRTECLYHAGMALTVKSVETIGLTELGYLYVSRLVPSQIGLEARTSAGHSLPAGAGALDSCKFVPWREIDEGGASWADVIDFYARHSCDVYAFYRGYHFRTAPGPLPAHPTAPAPEAAKTR